MLTNNADMRESLSELVAVDHKSRIFALFQSKDDKVLLNMATLFIALE